MLEHQAECSNEKNHTPGPIGYVAFFDWCEVKNKTHKQTKCPVCKLWKIWVKR